MRVVLLLLAPSLAVAAAVAAPAPTREADIQRPLAWLLAAQNDNGGWGAEARSKADVATTALSGIALLRLGHSYSNGRHAAATRKAVEYVLQAVEKTAAGEPAINGPGTQPQAKLGRYIDTFLAANYLAEVMPSVPLTLQARVRKSLDACVVKIQALQRQDGGFSPDGWAPVLSNAFAAGGLHAAQRAGSDRVDKKVLRRANERMLKGYDATNERFATEESAGVELYQAAGTTQAAAREGRMGSKPAQAAAARLRDENFVRGFGSYGGEEHVSYMMSSEALASVGGKDWEQWDKAIRARLAAIQRKDGTWRGDHCITSTSFCTAASLITLTIKPRPRS